MSHSNESVVNTKEPVKYTNKLIKKTALLRKKTQNGDKFVREIRSMHSDVWEVIRNASVERRRTRIRRRRRRRERYIISGVGRCTSDAGALNTPANDDINLVERSAAELRDRTGTRSASGRLLPGHLCPLVRQPCTRPRSLNRVSTSAAVKAAGMSPLSGGG